MRKAIHKWDILIPIASTSPRSLHSVIFIAVVGGVLVARFAGVSLNLLDWPLLAGLAILVLGVPHGGFDVALAERRWQLNSPKRLGIFLAAYVAIAALIVTVWLALPGLALPLFLAMAAHHFGGDWDKELDRLPRLVIGAALICAPAILYRGEVVEIFSWITPPPTADRTAHLMALSGVPLLQAALMITLITALVRPWVAIEIGAVLLLGLLTPALCFFIVYFCGFHSVRHVFAVADELKPSSVFEFALRSMPYAPLAVVGTLVLAGTLSFLEISVELLGIVFVVLAALTAPHMILVDFKKASLDKKVPAH